MSGNSLDKQESLGNSSTARRKLLKGAVTTGAVVSTIGGRSAWAATCQLSGNLSNNASAAAWRLDNCYVLRGYSHGSWKKMNNSHRLTRGTAMDEVYGITLQSPLSRLGLLSVTGSMSISDALNGGYSGTDMQKLTAALNAHLHFAIEGNSVRIAETGAGSDNFFYKVDDTLAGSLTVIDKVTGSTEQYLYGMDSLTGQYTNPDWPL